VKNKFETVQSKLNPEQKKNQKSTTPKKNPKKRPSKVPASTASTSRAAPQETMDDESVKNQVTF